MSFNSTILGRFSNKTVALITMLFFATNAVSHHSAAMFDMEGNMVVEEGKVEDYQWANPHVYIHVSTTDENGNSIVWKIEHFSPNMLKRQGWKRTSFKNGDIVSITFHPEKSGKFKGRFIRAVTADGTKLGEE